MRACVRANASAADPASTGEFSVLELDVRPTASYHRAMVRVVARDLKHALCRVSEQAWRDVYALLALGCVAFSMALVNASSIVSANANVPSERYELPDGKLVELAGERFEIGERMFLTPSGGSGLSGDDNDAPRAVQHVAARSLQRADVDIQRDLVPSASSPVSLSASLTTRISQTSSCAAATR